MNPTSPTAETLLAHAGWVRALARELTRDAVEAEELAQDALSAALASREAARAPRAWLAALVRHRASRARRSSMRREARERDAARPEAQPSAAELVARVDAHRALVDELRALDEPWRETLFLRWFEGLPPRAIAARQGVPVATVHARLARGHELLRARLDRRAGGDRGAWLPAIAALALPAPPPAVGAALLGAVAMTKLGIGLACAAVVAALWLALRTPGATATPPAERIAARAAAPADSNAAEMSPESALLEERAALAAASAVREASADAAPARPTALGHVLDVEGRPLAGVEIAVHPPLDPAPPPVVSDADGRFELPRPSAHRLHTVSARRPGWVAVMVGELERTADELHVLLAPAISLAGHVVHADGSPAAGAAVELEPGDALRARLAFAPEHSREQSWHAVADETGAFAFEAAPALPGARLSAAGLPGANSDAVVAPLVTSDDLRIVLRAPSAPADALRGVVLDLDGTPRADAWVAAGDAGARTDEHGGFVLDRRACRGATRIRAAVAGQLPGQVDALAGSDDATRWPEPLVLRLGGPALAIEGRLVDQDGAPMAGRSVWLADPTDFGPVGERGTPSHVEAVLAGERGDLSCATDAEGRFRLDGLLPRAYTLAADDPATLRVARREGVVAGARDLELCFDPVARPITVAGRCVDSRGEPIAGVAISAGRRLSRAGGSWQISSNPVTTDAAGRFRIPGLPPQVDRLHYKGEAVLPDQVELEPGAPRDALELVLPRRCHVQVEAGARFADATHFIALDAGGNRLLLCEFRGRSSSSSSTGPLTDGRSAVLAVSDAAATIALRRDGEELARREVSLAPGEPTLVRFE